MEDKKIDLLSQMLSEVSDSMTNFLRKSGINGRVVLTIKPDKNFPNKYFTKEEILDVVNEVCMSHYGVKITDPTTKSNMLYKKIFFKIYHDMGHSYKMLLEIFTINQSSYLHHVKTMEEFLEEKDGLIVERYQEVLDRLNSKYSVSHETDDDNTQ